MTGLLTTVVAAGAVTAAPANAVAGDTATAGTYTFAVKLDIGSGERSCTGALVDKQWVLTASSCFAENPSQGFRIAAGAPKWKTTATIGRTDLTQATGSVTDVVELVPHDSRDLVMAKLAKPVTGVTPVPVASAAPRQGEELKVAGFGRTKTQWVPDQLHATSFTVDSTQDVSMSISPKSPADGAVCKGDTGGPALRETAGRVELVGINSRSWQGGCLGTDASETRKEAVDTRLDDLSTWVLKVSYRDVFPKAPWNKATHVASGYFTGGSAGGTRHMDLIVRWNDSEVTLYQGADDKDPYHPFVAEYQLGKPLSEDPKTIWQYANNITGASFGNGTDGLVVRWGDGELTQYTHVDKDGFHDEKTILPGDHKGPWAAGHVKQMTAGRYTDNALRDDLVVVWEDGRVTLHPDLNTNGVANGAKKTLVQKNTTWPFATQITAGEFTGKKTADLLVRWGDGEVTTYPGVDAEGLHGEINVKPKEKNAPWLKATVVTAGAFVANDRANDVLVRWENGTLSLFPGVDAAGLHEEVKLVG
ncbi:S1 family peptidase [Streptomyces noursei]|uniref:S1 family peptidase n=1 Tax=Streptomyces noursei TaxID=1971 RepID=UPI001963AC5B|nr:S1 family peptidase [Streptomyces noursei]QRX91131.1 S1 family peptidase [Streptomyces noursei]